MILLIEKPSSRNYCSFIKCVKDKEGTFGSSLLTIWFVKLFYLFNPLLVCSRLCFSYCNNNRKFYNAILNKKNVDQGYLVRRYFDVLRPQRQGIHLSFSSNEGKEREVYQKNFKDFFPFFPEANLTNALKQNGNAPE